MKCKNCGHPHGWYDGLCMACARAAGVALVPTRAPEPPTETLVGEVITGTTSDLLVAEVKAEPKPEPEPKPKAPRRRRARK